MPAGKRAYQQPNGPSTLLNVLVERAQILPEALGIAIVKERFSLRMCALPNWNGADKQASPFCHRLECSFSLTRGQERLRRDAFGASSLVGDER
jgi:hypothetical protein